MIGCSGSDVTWELTCVGNQWLGTYSNCTAGRSIQFLSALIGCLLILKQPIVQKKCSSDLMFFYHIGLLFKLSGNVIYCLLIGKV